MVELITAEGYTAATTRRIAEWAGVSHGAVQYHFGSKAKLFEALLQRSHERFVSLVDNEALLKGDLEERVGMFVALSWRHYQDKLYLAAIEILMVTRSHREVVSLVELTEQQAVEHRKRMREIFPECELDDRALTEALISNHIFLTGLTVETILEPRLGNIGGYLRRATQAMVAMLQVPA